HLPITPLDARNCFASAYPRVRSSRPRDPMAEISADENAIRALCAELFTAPQRLFNTLTHRVERRFPIEPHTHADLLQLDLLVGCAGQAWSQSRWLPIRGITALIAYPHEPHGYELLPGDPPSRVYHLKLRVSKDSPLL